MKEESKNQHWDTKKEKKAEGNNEIEEYTKIITNSNAWCMENSNDIENVQGKMDWQT